MQRPDAVHEDAVFDPALNRWSLSAGTGVSQTWRTSGELYSQTTRKNGRAVGAFSIFHPDGSLAIEGVSNGEYIDAMRMNRSQTETDVESFALTGSTVVRMELEAGSPYTWATFRFWDADGTPCAFDGTPMPPRPRGVPPAAQFVGEDDVGPRRWVAGEVEQGSDQFVGLRVWYAESGHVLYEQCFDERGSLRWSRKATQRYPIDELVDVFRHTGKLDFTVVRVMFDADLHRRLATVALEQGDAHVRHYMELLRYAEFRQGRRFNRVFAQWDSIASLFEQWTPAADSEHAAAIVACAAEAWVHLGRSDALVEHWDAVDRHGLVDQLERRIEHNQWSNVPLPDRVVPRLRGSKNAWPVPQAFDAGEVAMAAANRLGMVSPEPVLSTDTQALLVDLHGHVAWFEAGRLDRAPLCVDRLGRTLSRYVIPFDVSDERRCLWSRYEGWWFRQRYGHGWLLSGSRLDPDLFDFRPSIDLFVACPDDAWSLRVKQLFDALAPDDAIAEHEVVDKTIVREYATRARPKHGPETVLLACTVAGVLRGPGRVLDGGALPRRTASTWDLTSLELVEETSEPYHRLNRMETLLIHEGYSLRSVAAVDAL